MDLEGKVIIEKSRSWEIFMEQELRFGLDLGRLALLKKMIWADYEQLFSTVFSSFHGQRKLKTL